MDALIFIDTNIFLDFYRYPQGSAVLPMLKHIDSNHSKIITGSQIEMEFKKNRQKVIIKSIKGMKSSKWDEFNIPVIISESQPAHSLRNLKNKTQKQINLVKSRIENILINPGKYDKVYQTAQRLFKDNTEINLNRTSSIRKHIRFLSKKRFILGYPPRKDSDIAIGDSINWEWIIHCAKEYKKDIIIVSRDSDYGCQYKEPVINDWLLQEFKSRISNRRKLILTNKLTYAFKSVFIEIEDKEEENEIKLLESLKFMRDSSKHLNSFNFKTFNEIMSRSNSISSSSLSLEDE